MQKANVFTPHRLDGESFAAYRERRQEAKRAAERITLSGEFRPTGKNTHREEHRDLQRKTGTMQKIAGSYGRGLRNWITNLNRAQQAQRLGKKQAA